MKHILPYWAAAHLMLSGSGGSGHKPATGHRNKRYSITKHDIARLEAAKEKRERKAAKRYEDHCWAVSNNPCRTTL